MRTVDRVVARQEHHQHRGEHAAEIGDPERRQVLLPDAGNRRLLLEADGQRHHARVDPEGEHAKDREGEQQADGAQRGVEHRPRRADEPEVDLRRDPGGNCQRGHIEQHAMQRAARALHPRGEHQAVDGGDDGASRWSDDQGRDDGEGVGNREADGDGRDAQGGKSADDGEAQQHQPGRRHGPRKQIGSRMGDDRRTGQDCGPDVDEASRNRHDTPAQWPEPELRDPLYRPERAAPYRAGAARYAAACPAMERPSAMQSGMPIARNPLPVTNRPGMDARR